MAVTATHLLTGSDITDLSTYTTASITPSANKLILALVGHNVGSGTPNQPTLSGNGITWVVVATQIVDTIVRVTVFRGLVSSPSAGAVTIDFASQSQSRCLWSINEFDGIDTGGANGADAVVQSASNSATSGTSLTVTLSAFGATGNATYGGIMKQTAEAITEGAGFTELGENQDADNVFRINTEWKDSNDTSVDWSWATAAVRVAGIGVEIKEAVALAGGTASRMTLLGVGR